MCDYRTRKLTYLAKTKVIIEYDWQYKENFDGTWIEILETINKAMDRYGFKVADVTDSFTGEVLITVRETEEEEEE
jgi:hypothetical protein